MRYEILDELGAVSNIIIANLEFVETHYPGLFREVPTPEPAPEVPAVPQTVTRNQAQSARYLTGMLESVEALMTHPDTPMLQRLAWKNALEFKRQSPTVLAMGAALGLTDADIDGLFIAAAGIEA